MRTDAPESKDPARSNAEQGEGTVLNSEHTKDGAALSIGSKVDHKTMRNDR